MRTCELAKREKKQLKVGEPDKVVVIKTAVKKLCGAQISQVRVESCISKSLHCANSWSSSSVRRGMSVNFVPNLLTNCHLIPVIIQKNRTLYICKEATRFRGWLGYCVTRYRYCGESLAIQQLR
jgi:hypothetical protein